MNVDTILRQRRDELMRRIGPRAAVFIPGGHPARRNSDVEHKFRAPSDLLYLTGFGEPEAACVIAPGKPDKFVMFVRPRDPEREIWTGRRLGVEGAVARLGADKAYPIAELGEKLKELFDGVDEIHYLPGDDAEADRLVIATVASLRELERRGKKAPRQLIDLRGTLHEMRLVKDEDSLDRLRRAAAITAEAHTAAMRAARDGVFEYEIEALIDYTFRRRGAHGPGYGTIVGGGANATILHYVDNQDALRKGDLLLIDAGAEVDGFTADVTRTYPIGATFTPAQRKLYELVLDAEKRCIEAVRPGATVDGIHDIAVRRLTEGLVELGLLAGGVDALIESGAYKRYYMHRTSHWLGMDVHDVGRYATQEGARPLAPGMVLTIEPGLYVPEDAHDLPAEFRGIGIRIEDDVLVTAAGHEVLTAAIPKEVADLERLALGPALALG